MFPPLAAPAALAPAIGARDFARLEILSTGGYAQVPASVMQGLDTSRELAATRASLARCPQANVDFAISAAREVASSLPSTSQE